MAGKNIGKYHLWLWSSLVKILDLSLVAFGHSWWTQPRNLSLSITKYKPYILIRLEYIHFYFISTYREFTECKIIDTNVPLGRATFAWGFQKHSQYLPVFNYHMKLMNEKGTIQKLFQKYKSSPQVCPDKAGSPIKFDSCLTAFLSLTGRFNTILFLFALTSYARNLQKKQYLIFEEMINKFYFCLPISCVVTIWGKSN